MKRVAAAVALLTALGVLCKLAWKGSPSASAPVAVVSPEAGNPGRASIEADPSGELRAKYPGQRELVDRVLRDYHHNALAIEQTDGLRGLVLLDRLGLEAVFLYEKYPREFHRLRDALNDEAAADLLLHWREYFALKRAEELDRGILIAEIARLGPAERRAAARYPNALPLILAEPVGVAELIDRLKGDPEELRDALAVLDFISLETGSAHLRAALRVLDEHGPLALEAFRLQGPEGFALVKLYGEVLETVGPVMSLEDALILLRVNSDDVDALLASHSVEWVASALRHVAAVNLVPVVGSSPHALRLTVEFGALGDRALQRAGPDAAEVVYAPDLDGSPLRHQAVAALAEHGPMALAILAKYTPDPSFREILRRYGPRVIPPVAQSDPVPEALAALRSKEGKSLTEALAQGVLALSRDNGQATIRLIESDGIDRVETLNSTEVAFYQFLPLYDALHLVRVLGRGHAPTGGELTWALVDGCFVVADALSLAALQPEGAAAAELARSELKVAVEQAAKSAGRELTEGAVQAGGRAALHEGAEVTAERLSRWWAVRLAGGTYAVMQRFPEAIGKLSLPELSRIGQPLCTKAGLRLSTWKPVRFLAGGEALLKALPAGRGVKYVGVQAVQAGVGVVAIHKMEEHLASRRP